MIRRMVATWYLVVARCTSAMISSRECHRGGPRPSSRWMAAKISSRHVDPVRTRSETVKSSMGAVNPWLAKSAASSTKDDQSIARPTRERMAPLMDTCSV